MTPAPLIERGESIATRRLRLTLATLADMEALAWLEGVLAPDWRLDDLRPHVEAGGCALVLKDDRPVGIVVAARGVADRAATVPFIAIEPGERFRGLGGEAGLAVEHLLRERTAAHLVLAPVPEQRGLAVYFWLRLGFRPLLQVESPSEPLGLDGKPLRGIWMARDRA